MTPMTRSSCFAPVTKAMSPRSARSKVPTPALRILRALHSTSRMPRSRWRAWERTPCCFSPSRRMEMSNRRESYGPDRPTRLLSTSVIRERSDTTQSVARSWSRTEWPTRRLRRSPGWRTAVRPRRERSMARPANCPERCTIFVTTNCTMNFWL